MNEPDSAAPAVELRRISKRYGARVILAGIDLAVRQGESLVLVGPSGSGKSTLLKMVSGIETPDDGEVWLAGENCTAMPPHQRKVHTVFQNYALFPHLDVAGNVAFPLAVAGVAKSEQQRLVQTALAWVKLQGHSARKIERLSGGEKQRVALARALVDSPKCVLLDEPLSALDPHLRAETLELLQSIQDRLGMTFVFITHDRDEALRLGDRIGVLNGGRLEQVGTPREIYEQPATPFVASFMGKINWLAGEWDGGRGELRAGGERLAGPRRCAVRDGAVRIGVRPEDLCVGEGGMEARVAGRTFLGDCVVLELELPGGTRVVADQRAPFCEASVGETVRVSWPAGAAHLFPAEDSEGGA